MKRLCGLALPIILLLTLVILPGCGGGDNTNATNTNLNSNVTPTPSPSATPEAGGTPLSKIDEILGKMREGNIVFNVPPSMTLQEAKTVVLLLSPKQTMEELEGQLRERNVVGDVKRDRIKIADRMQAVLSGDGFQITPITADTLPVSAKEATQWSWDVRPQRPGTLHLHVVLNAMVDMGDGTGLRPYPLKTFDQTYVVEVPQRGAAAFLGYGWPWLLAVLLVPAGGAAWLWYRRRKRPRTVARLISSAGRDARIFLSYRRDDSAGHAGRLRDALAAHFGAERVFMDIDSIGYGDDFVEAVEKAVGSCAVVVVVIGREWLSAADKKGNRRLDDPRDFVRLEVETALKRGVRIIPVLVEGASMPGEDVLPPPLAMLARRNAIELSDERWQFDTERLAAALEQKLAGTPAARAESDDPPR